MEASTPKFVSVLFPLALPGLYSYEVPEDLRSQIKFGIRVEVPLRNRLYAALVIEMHDALKLDYRVKNVVSIIDRESVITGEQYEFWKWIAKYYTCKLGEVMQVAMPSGLKLASETKLLIHPDYEIDANLLDDKEYLLAEALTMRGELSIQQVQDILQQKSVHPVIQSLLDKQVIHVKEELRQKYKVKKQTYVLLAPELLVDNELLELAFEAVKRSEKQTNVLLSMLSGGNGRTGIARPLLCRQTQVDSSVIQAMVKKEILLLEDRTISRIEEFDGKVKELPPLSDIQTRALNQMKVGFDAGKVNLVHGVTGSGKTRIYMELISEWLDTGKQVLYLIPEIALTTQITARLQAVFGDDLALYHSKLNQHERVELWNAVKKGKKLIVGARSAIFLPFVDLGSIIVDESHDISYKQHDPAPRYNARDMAIYYGAVHKIPVILGTATPSIESYAHALNRKYNLIELPERFGEAVLPEIQLVDLKKAHQSRSMEGPFSKELLLAINQSLDAGEQIILFQNRRGFAPILSCELCGWKAECINCDVSLTYHKHLHQMKCHYCAYQITLPEACPACGNEHIHVRGTGTQKIEVELQALFPNAKIQRLDYDAASSKEAHSEILEAFEHREIDILVGTQMVTKGLDFDHISLVGIIEADGLIHFPDFRAHERAYQILTQVAGRAGRKNKQGKVIIQCYDPLHPVIQDVIRQDYTSFYKKEIQERQQFYYPPFGRLIQISLKHRKADIIEEASMLFAFELKKELGKRVIGPSIPTISRIRNQYIRTILIKLENKMDVIDMSKREVLKLKEKFEQTDGFKSVRISIDVDPM